MHWRTINVLVWRGRVLFILSMEKCFSILSYIESVMPQKWRPVLDVTRVIVIEYMCMTYIFSSHNPANIYLVLQYNEDLYALQGIYKPHTLLY